jgi:hypothetical protein
MLAIAKIKRHASARIAEDPPDERFRETVVLPQPALDSAAFGAGDNTPLGRACANLTEGAAATEALATALERAAAAELHHDLKVADERLVEAQAFGDLAATLLRQSPAAAEPLVRALVRGEPAIAVSKGRQAVVEALLREHNPAELLSRRGPDSWLALLFRGSVSRDHLTFDPERALADEALTRAMAQGAANSALAQAIAQAAAASSALGSALNAWTTRVKQRPRP